VGAVDDAERSSYHIIMLRGESHVDPLVISALHYDRPGTYVSTRAVLGLANRAGGSMGTDVVPRYPESRCAGRIEVHRVIPDPSVWVVPGCMQPLCIESSSWDFRQVDPVDIWPSAKRRPLLSRMSPLLFSIKQLACGAELSTT
jgi:hypothetical protein